MAGKRYNWHKRWQVDLSACTATHDSGLVFQFRQAEDDPAMLDGEAINLEEWQAQQLERMPLPDLVKHVQRLSREAGDAYLWQLNKRH
jgi:hypothetical protein